MKSLITIIALVLLGAFAPQSPVAAQDLDCDAIEGYLDEVDTAMAEEVHALVTTPGWAEEAQAVSTRLNMEGTSFEDASAAEVEPLLDLIGIPGNVLSSMAPHSIPTDALPVHESSTGFWIALPGWMRASMAGDSREVETTAAALKQHARDNAGALAAIDEACPGLLDARLGNADRFGDLFDQLDSEEGDPDALANATVADLDGIGTFFLVMPAGWTLAIATPAPVARSGNPEREPATVKAITPDATPAATPGT